MLNYPYFSIKETVEKTKDKLKQVEDLLDHGYYDFDEANIFGTGYNQDRNERLNQEEQKKLLETFRRAPLKEFLAQSGTTGIAGAAYLVPTKIYQIMYDSAVQADLCADISIAMIPPDQIPGSTLKVDIAKDGSYVPHKFSSGGKMPDEEIETVTATLDFTTTWGINFRIANDLIEDSQFDVIEMHLRNAGREMGEYATNELLTIMYQAPDGDGTLNLNGATGNANETRWTGATTYDVEEMIRAVVNDSYLPDTMVCSHEAMMHTIYRTIGSSNNDSAPYLYNVIGPGGGWPKKIMDLNILYTEVDIIARPSGTDGEDCKTLVFAKDYAILTGRKRWLRIEKYSDPVRDLVGATVTARQDSVTAYKDAIAYIYETAD